MKRKRCWALLQFKQCATDNNFIHNIPFPGNLSAECSGIFFTTKDTNDPKKFHGMNNEFLQ